MTDEDDAYFKVDTTKINAKPETIKMLIDTSVKQINFLIKQVKSIEASLTEDEKSNKDISTKLEELYSKIDFLKNEVKRLIDICEKANN